MQTEQVRNRILELRDIINEANRRYYVDNAPTLSDYEFDMLLKELERLEKEHPEFASADSPTRRVGSDLKEEGLKKEFDQYPHKYPMLLVDKVIELEEGKRIVAVKNVTANEPFFQGHFPGNPIMPGVLITESLAQTGAIMLLSMEENKGKLGVFTGINNFKFRKQVVPGDTLILEAELTQYRHGMGKANVKATVEGAVAAMGEISFAVIENAANN